MNSSISIVILTYNEEIHLPRLLQSVSKLNPYLYVLDSGSDDQTVSLAESYGAQVAYNKFTNHPLQWQYALNHFNVITPWTIGLDADQVVSEELLNRLKEISTIDHDVEGIYFNRKNIFKGKWIKYGGYFPKYMLKMFRTGRGFSDLTEMMDHRFIVKGKTIVWEDGYLLEENLKENDIKFWIDKHNRYSDLVAEQEYLIRNNKIKFDQIGSLSNPDKKVKHNKSRWYRIPLFLRPFLYFFYRYFLLMGFLDGRNGLIFHFMQALWFRFIVDIKIYEKLKRTKTIKSKERVC